MKNPHMLYRCPGSEVFEGVACETIIVEAEEVEAAKAEGWCSDWMKAKASHEAELASAAQVQPAEPSAEVEPSEPADEPAPDSTTIQNLPSGLVAVHKGRGKYEVVDALGTVVASGLSKAEAQERVAAG